MKKQDKKCDLCGKRDLVFLQTECQECYIKRAGLEYNKALEDIERLLLKKFKFASMPLIKEIKELKK